jgi:hypothetical protein
MLMQFIGANASNVWLKFARDVAAVNFHEPPALDSKVGVDQLVRVPHLHFQVPLFDPVN